MLLTHADIELFRELSGDRNPLHGSVEFARRTPFAEPIAHGMLGCVAAVDTLSGPGSGLVELEAQFHRPLYPGVEYRVQDDSPSCARSPQGPRTVRLGVYDGGRRCLELALRLGAAVVEEPRLDRPATRSAAADLGLAELARGAQAHGEYGLSAADVAPAGRRWPTAYRLLGIQGLTAMTWCSFLSGMELPGRRGLLCRVALRMRPGAAAAPRFSARVADTDPRFQMVTVEGRLDCGAAGFADAEIEALVCEPVPAPRLAALNADLPPSTRLRGRTAVVAGGSRGLGAALALALAGQGCRVLVGHRRGGTGLAPLTAQLAGRSGELIPVVGDVARLEWAAEVRRRLAGFGGGLDYLILSAAPALGAVDFDAAQADRIGRYAARALDLVGVPLSGLADALERARGTCLLVSSAAVESLPAQWPHYVAAKSAAEGLLRWTAANRPAIRCLVTRPGMVLTDQTNTPAGRVAAGPVEGVAAGICRGLLRTSAPGRDENRQPSPASGTTDERGA